MKYHLISILFFFYACKTTSKSEETVQSMDKPKIEKEELVTFDNACFEDRKTTKEIVEHKAKIIKVATWWMMVPDESGSRWQPCEMPEMFQEENLTVIVSGEVKEIYPNERRAGTPFIIHGLVKADE